MPKALLLLSLLSSVVLICYADNLCTQEGLLTATQYWTQTFKQQMYESINVLERIEIILQERTRKRLFSPIINKTSDEKILALNVGYFYLSSRSNASYLLLKVVEPGEIVNYTITKSNGYNLVWSSSPPSATEYCKKFHSTSCPSELSCPIYCQQPELFHNNMLEYDLSLLSSLEEFATATFEGKKIQQFLSIATIRNFTMIFPQLFGYRLLGDISFPLVDAAPYTTDMLSSGPLLNPSRSLQWRKPSLQYDVENPSPSKLSVYIGMKKPLYIENRFWGFGSISFRTNWGNEYLESLKPTPSGFCVVVDNSGILVLTGVAGRKFFNISDTKLDFSLTTAKNGSLSSILNLLNNNLSVPTGNADELLLSNPTAIHKEILVDGKAWIVSVSSLQLLPLSLICFANSKELLNSGSVYITPSSISIELTQGEVSVNQIEILNTGFYDLQHKVFVTPPPESDWLTIDELNNQIAQNSSRDAFFLFTPQNGSSVLVLTVNSSLLVPGRLTTVGILIDTNDAAEGYCFTNRTICALQISVKYRIDEIVYASWDSGMGIAFAVLTSLLLLFCFIVLTCVYIWRGHVWIRTASWICCSLIVIGSMIGLASIYFWIGEPTTFKCSARIWFASVGFVLMFATLLGKNLRVFMIMTMTTQSQQREPISESQVFPLILIVLSIELLILILWTSINTPTIRIVTEASYLSPNQNAKKCGGDNLLAWLLLLFIYNGILLFIGCILAFKCRRISDLLNEARLIALCVYNIVLTSAVVIPLLLFLSLPPNIELLLISLSVMSVFVTVIGSLLLPRFWKIWVGDDFKLPASSSSPHGVNHLSHPSADKSTVWNVSS